MRKVLLTGIGCYLGILTASAQGKSEWNQVFRQINQEVLTNSKAYSTLGDATSTIGQWYVKKQNSLRMIFSNHMDLKMYASSLLK
jgi:hypothetical protein